VIKVVRWIDQHLWSIPILLFIATELALAIWTAASPKPLLLAAAPLVTRQAIYSSVAGSSSALLGLALAAVAILAAFGPRPTQTAAEAKREASLTRARNNIIVGSLLTASLFLLMLLVTATLALAVDSKHSGNSAITVMLEGAGPASVVGLLVSGVGLALVIVERSRP
jgi:uncharacterized membrane protein